MNTQKSMIHMLTSRSFQANKTRNRVAILAIVLTTLMFTSLFVLSQSMVRNMREMNFRQAGNNSHITFRSLTDEEIEKITSHEAVRDWGRSTVIGVAENEELTGRQIEIRYGDEAYAASVFSLPTTGTLPVREDEIALDTITLDKLGLAYELGQEIQLYWRKDLNSSDYTVSSFVLCGVWDGNDAAMASMAWVSEEFVKRECAGINPEEQLSKGQFLGMEILHVNVYDDNALEQQAEQILEDTGLAGISFGTNYAYDSVMNHNIFREVFPMLICMVLVFASGYLIIYNVFQISVAADIQFYGKLKTLGTSKKQLKRIIYGQVNRLCLIGIPIGLLLGYGLGAVLVPMIITGIGMEAIVSVNPYVFIGAALFAYVTVLVSCMKPAKAAGKVSPVEALRYTDCESKSKRKIKKSTEGAGICRMALANLGRNKKRTVIVIGSLTLGLVLLTGIYAKNASFDIDKYMSQQVISDFEVKDSSIATYFSTYNPYGTTISEELVSRVEALEGLEAEGRLYSQVITHEISSSALANIQTYYNANERLTYIEAVDSQLAQAYYDMMDSGECVSILYGIDGLILDVFSEDYRILDGTFNREEFLSGNYVIVEAASGAEEKGPETQPTYSVGDRVDLNGKTYEVMGMVTNLTPITEGINSDSVSFLSFYLPADEFQEMYPDNTLRKFFFDVAEPHREAAEEMLITYRNQEDHSLTFKSKSTLEEHYHEQTRAEDIMGFSISFIIAFVGILNFINSMVTAIVSRQKEFAMIQSVGMTKRQLRSMLICEGLYYAGGTLAVSYILGAAAVAFGVRMMVSGSWTATFQFTILPLVICTPILIFFAILIPYICFRNLEKQSIVERLRTL